MSNQTLLQERVQLFRDVTYHRRPKRIPNLSHFFTWKILDSQYKLSEAMMDWDKMFKLVCEFQKRYDFDACVDVGLRNPISVTSSLGEHFYKIDDENEIINIDDYELMKEDEYSELIDNPLKFYWTKVLPRKYPDLTMNNLKKSMYEFLAFDEYARKIGKELRETYQCLTITETFTNSQFFIYFPFEILFNWLRGIKGSSVDLRKHKAEIMEINEVLYETTVAPSIEATLSVDTSEAPFDKGSVFLGHSILSTKQFEEIYWPVLKKITDKLASSGKTMYLVCESDIMRFYEYFQEIPKGCLAIHLEMDNIFEVRKKLPNICLAGGMTTDLLGNGTQMQCVNYAKKLIDELGRDGGYIFSQNKMVSFRNDCKRENLLAVNEFVRNYRG